MFWGPLRCPEECLGAAVLDSMILEHLTGSVPGQGAVECCIVLQGQRRNSQFLASVATETSYWLDVLS